MKIKHGTIIKSVISFQDDQDDYGFVFNQNFNNERTTRINSSELPEIIYKNDQQGVMGENYECSEVLYGKGEIFGYAKEVDPYIISKEESAALKLYTTRYYSALQKANYPPNQPVKVYESSKYFTERSSKPTIIDIKSSIDLAASWWMKAERFWGH